MQPRSVVETGVRRFAVVSAAMLAALLQFADTTIVNVALPTIDGELGASTDEGAWFVTAYLIANVIVIPLSPWLHTILGRKRFFALAIAGFTIVSMLCGMAHDVVSEILLRGLQGAFGGGIMVPAQQTIRDTLPPKDLGKSQSLFALAVVIGPTIGPTLGGLLTDNLSWRWVFFINALPGLIATILVLLFVRDPEDAKRTPFDALGIALLAIGLGSLQWVLGEGERRDWFSDSAIVIAIVTSVVALAAFAFWELRGTARPAVALGVLRQRTVWAMSVASAGVGMTLYGLVFLFPVYSQGVLGFTTTMTGLAMMVRAGAMLLLYPVTTWVVSRQNVDLRIVAVGGLAVVAITTWFQAAVITTQSSFETFIATQVIGGVGFAFIFVPLNVALLRSLALPSVPAALAISRLAQSIGGSFGSALTATLVSRAAAAHQAALADSVDLSHHAVGQFIQTHGTGAIAQLTGLVLREAANLATADVTRTLAGVAALSALLPLLLAPPPRAKVPSR